ncbi:MAG: TetR/AcrR family transcriptional regulator [Methylobacteriaceae bacterium]|nr:TetR/AcrR family transcriptional regulator [Methylobacteriaceae bacterium]MBV9634002.1 TetR/AcrR family transcriptional regulator [Methylobacteriaceae bacterium]MBV9701561.1 TetR/AcrR family transcriptional regulator [Methylobacteriaceae bacterium]
MPRPREFDIEEVLDRATRLFWQRGYGGTSLNDLEGAMGIGRTSIYAAFGGKEGLFLAVLDHYDGRYSIKLREALRAAGGIRAAIRRYFSELLRAFADPDLPLGCLITNVGVEGDRGATRLGRKIAASIAHTEDAFYDLLRRGQASGEVAASADARAIARYFVASTHGLSTLAKALPTPSALTDVVEAILANLDAMLMPARRARRDRPRIDVVSAAARHKEPSAVEPG